MKKSNQPKRELAFLKKQLVKKHGFSSGNKVPLSEKGPASDFAAFLVAVIIMQRFKLTQHHSQTTETT